MLTHYMNVLSLRPACAGMLCLATAFLVGCEGGRSEYEEVVVQGGDASRGVAVIDEVGCGACHTIPGIDGAEGMVGPPLTAWANRSYIAGRLPNKPNNLIPWVMDAPSIEPSTAMPDLDLTEQQARDVAAYLYSLR